MSCCLQTAPANRGRVSAPCRPLLAAHFFTGVASATPTRTGSRMATSYGRGDAVLRQARGKACDGSRMGAKKEPSNFAGLCASMVFASELVAYRGAGYVDGGPH